jgi:FMN phosphatase YigB (HAD superfamily)
MLKIKVTLLSLVLLLGFNTQSAELTRYVTPKTVAATLATAGAVYGVYKIYRARCAKNIKKAAELKEALEINSALIEDKPAGLSLSSAMVPGFKIDKDTVIAFDIHKVIADFNVLKMIITAIRPWIIFTACCYPGMFPIIKQQWKAGASPQEMFEAVEAAYPGNKEVQIVGPLAIDIMAQLNPIQDTINIAKKLIANGYKVIFASNMEPKVFERFLADFPVFKDCEKVLPRPENGWTKKPLHGYFEILKSGFNDFQKTNNKALNNVNGALNILFIDDKIENVKPAIECGVPSLVYLSPNQLRNDLMAMGANLD